MAANLLHQHLTHRLLLMRLVGSDIGDDPQTGSLGCGGTGFAVFNGNSGLGLGIEFFQGVEVDLWVGLRGGRIQTSGGAVDTVAEVFVLSDFSNTSFDTWASR